MTVARHDLGRYRLGLQTEALEDLGLELRRSRRVGADGARNRAGRGLIERPLEPIGVAPGLEREARELDAEGRGLGVNAVGAADTHGVRMRARLLYERLDKLVGLRDEQLARRLHLQRERGVENVRRSEPVMDPAPGVAGVRAEYIDESGDVVVGDRLALVHRLNGELRGADRLQILGGRPVHLLAGRDLDLAPRLHPGLVGPDGAHLRAGVARDHAGRLIRGCGAPGDLRSWRCPARRRQQGRRAASERQRGSRPSHPSRSCATTAERR